MRLFVSIEPQSEILDVMEGVISELAGLNRRLPIRWTPRENLHLTLLFMGEMNEGQVPNISQRLKESAGNFSRVFLELSGILLLPNRQQPRIIAISLHDQSGVLKKLHGLITDSLASFCQTPDKPFKPHITLGRLKTRGYIKLPRDHSLAVEGIIPVDKIHLMQSDLTPSGSIYTTLATFNFKHA